MRTSLALAALLALVPLAARAHPHVWVEARSELVYDGEARVSAVRHAWIFDEPFSAFAIQGLDQNADKKLSREELQPLAEVNVTSLVEFRYFTFVKVAKAKGEFAAPTDYWLDYDGTRLTLNFTLPLKRPVAHVGQPLTLEVYDPEYFVDFTLIEKEPIRLAGAPANCRLAVERPKELDAQTAATLSQIGPEERDLPPELSSITSSLANRATVTCG